MFATYCILAFDKTLTQKPYSVILSPSTLITLHMKTTRNASRIIEKLKLIFKSHWFDIKYFHCNLLVRENNPDNGHVVQVHAHRNKIFFSVLNRTHICTHKTTNHIFYD